MMITACDHLLSKKLTENISQEQKIEILKNSIQFTSLITRFTELFKIKSEDATAYLEPKISYLENDLFYVKFLKAPISKKQRLCHEIRLATKLKLGSIFTEKMTLNLTRILLAEGKTEYLKDVLEILDQQHTKIVVKTLDEACGFKTEREVLKFLYPDALDFLKMKQRAWFKPKSVEKFVAKVMEGRKDIRLEDIGCENYVYNCAERCLFHYITTYFNRKAYSKSPALCKGSFITLCLKLFDTVPLKTETKKELFDELERDFKRSKTDQV